MEKPNEIAATILNAFPELDIETDGEEIEFWCSFHWAEPAALADKLSDILGIDRNEIFKLL